MILQDNIKIQAKRGSTRILKKIFDFKLEIGKYYTIPIEKLSITSHYKVKVKCDFCDFEREIPYRQYIINIKKDGKYYCSKCSVTKMENSKFEKYGEKYYNGTKKKNKTIMTLYGVENIFQLEEIKEKSKKTNLEKYGNENYRNIEKHKETIMKLYGVDNISKLDTVKKQKIATSLKNWGVIHPRQNKEVCDRMVASFIKNRLYDLNNMIDYRYKVYQLTLKNKKILLDNWDGNDYYDKEYIYDNFNLEPSDKNYPTIDHKISIFYCFMNNISIEDVAALDNLCITKKSINSRKSRKNENDFINNPQ